jgi:hypothetical protein
MSRRERADSGDDEILFWPADDWNAVAACVRLIVWCLPFGEPRGFAGCGDCSHQVEPAPAEMANRYGPETSVLDWSKRLVCSVCGSHNSDMVVTGTQRR